jgi:hypothetical protein
VATALNVVEAPYANVGITVATTPGANVLLNSGNSPTAVFGGSGTFSVATTGNIDITANTTPIQGSSVSLTSSTGNIGLAMPISTHTGTLILTATKLSVNVTDSAATTSVTGFAGTTFTLADTVVGGTGLTIGSSLSAATIDLSTTASAIAVNGSLGIAGGGVSITSGAGLTVGASANIIGKTVTLDGVGDVTLNGNVGTAATNTVQITTAGNIIGSKGGSVSGVQVDLQTTGTSTNIGSSGQAVNTAAGTLTSNGSGSGNSFISQTGNVILGASSGNTFSLTVAGNLEVQSDLSSGGAVTLSTTKSGTLTLDSGVSIGNPAANVSLTSAGDMTLTGSVFATTIGVSAGGNFLQNASSDLVGNTVSVSVPGGTLTANGSFESATGATSSLMLSSSGTFSAGGNLGTVANNFSSVIVNITGTGSAASISGQVNTNGTGLGSGFQFMTKGPLTIANGAVLADTSDTLTASNTVSLGGQITDTTLNVTTTGTSSTITVSGTGAIKSGTANLTSSAALTIAQGATLNDGTDNLSAKGAVGIDGNITDTNLNITPTGAVTIGANNKNVLVLTTAGVITTPTFTNLGTINGTNSLAITTSGALTTGGATPGLTKGGAVTLTNTGTGQTVTAANGTITGTGSVTFISSNVNNLGITNGGGTLSFQNPTGNINITGSNGGFLTNLGGTLSISAKGFVTVGTTGSALTPFSGLTQLNQFLVTAGGSFTSGQSNITVVPDSKGNGGAINIAASNILFNGSGSLPNFILSANGTTGTGGAGGTITLNLPGTATSGITVGAAAGSYTLLAGGPGGGGTVSLTTPGQLTVNNNGTNFEVNATQAGYAGSGANVTLNGTKGVLINGDLDTRFLAGNPGNITINSGAKTAFIIGGSPTTTNGQINLGAGQGLFGDTVTITDAAGVTVSSGDVLSGATALVINGSTLTNSGGTVTTAALTIKSLTNVSVTGATPSAATVILSAPSGAVIFGTGATSLTAVQSDTNEDGGSITINAKTLTISSGGLTLDASAGAGKGGQGGTVTVDLTGTTNLALGSGKTPLSVLAANDGAGANGKISIITGGNLTVNALTALNLGSAIGSGSLTLSGKILHIDNAQTFATNSTDLKLLSLTSNTSGAFVLGGATGVTNGISGTGLTISSQQIVIANNGGAIYNGTGANASTLQATSSNGLSVSAKADIGKTTALLNVDASKSDVLQLKSISGNAYVNIVNGDETLGASVAKTLLVTSTGNLTPSGSIIAAGINFTAKSVSNFTTAATAITANATNGGFTVTDSQSALLTLNSIKATAGISVTTNGAITAASAITAGAANSVTLTAGGAITTKGVISAGQDITLQAGGTTGTISQGAAINAGLLAGDTLTLTAAGKGVITDAKTGYVASANTVDLNSGSATTGGSIGTSHTATFKVSAATLNVDAPGIAASVFINNSLAAATLGTATAGKTFDYTGALGGTTTSITAPTVLISSSGVTAAITTNATSLQVTAATGNIGVTDSQTLSVKLNTLTATSGTISVTSGGALTTSGVITASSDVTLGSGGNGNIVLGNSVTSSGGTATITAAGTGAISDAGSGTYKLSGTAVALNTTGTNIGSTKVAFRTATPSLALSTGTAGSVVVTNTNTQAAGIDTLQTSSVGSLVLTDTSTSTKNTGTLIIGDITASAAAGAITISTNERSLNVAAGSLVQTTDGNITLLNSYAANGANKPAIVIGDLVGTTATVIHAQSPTNVATGNVFIALGTVPATSTLKAGVTPTGGSPTPVIAGTVFFGTPSNLNGSITTGNTDKLNGLGRNLSFTTGKNAPTQIQLGNAVTITADPPAGVVSSTAVPGSTPSASSASSATTGLVSSATTGSASSTTTGSSTSTNTGSLPITPVVAGGTTSAGSTNISTTGGESLNISQASNVTPILSGTLPPGSASPSYSAAFPSLTSIPNASFTTANTNAILDGSASGALGNNLGAAISNNAVNSLTRLSGSGQTSQTAQPTLNQTTTATPKTSQSFSLKTLTGSASNVAHQPLDSGALLFNSEENTIVDTPYGSVSIAGGSVALLVAFDQGVAVYDLHDGHKGAIVLKNGSASTTLVPGHSAILTNSPAKSFEQINPTQFVAYRKLASRAVEGEAKLYQAEFDIVSMISGLKPLRDMIKSDSPKTRKVMANMLKTAAILSGLTQGGDSFSLYVAPQLTSYAPQAMK